MTSKSKIIETMNLTPVKIIDTKTITPLGPEGDVDLAPLKGVGDKLLLAKRLSVKALIPLNGGGAGDVTQLKTLARRVRTYLPKCRNPPYNKSANKAKTVKTAVQKEEAEVPHEKDHFINTTDLSLPIKENE